MRQVYVTVRCPSVCLSVCPIYRPHAVAAAAGLLLWARGQAISISSPSLSLLSLLTNTLPGPSASDVTTLWRYTNLFIIIIIIAASGNGAQQRGDRQQLNASSVTLSADV